MSAVFVEDRSLPVPTSVTGGTVFFDSTLTFSGPTQFILADAIYPSAGQYTLLDYSAGSFPGGQAELDAQVWPYLDDSALTRTTALSLTDDTVNKKVYLLMSSGVPGNGTIYFDSSVNFAGPTDFYLAASVASLPGTYTICEAVGSITGESNIRVYPLAGGLVVSSITKVGNTVQVVLR